VFFRDLAHALVAQGHTVTVLGCQRTAAAWDDNGVRVRMVGATRLRGCGWLVNRLRLQRQIRQLVATEGLDLVEAPDWCGLSAGLRPPCPLVIRCHGSATYFGHVLHEPVTRGIRLAERLAIRQATSIAAVSRFCADSTATLFGLGPVSSPGKTLPTPSSNHFADSAGRPRIPMVSSRARDLPAESAIRVIYNGVDTARFQVAGETGVEPGVILYFGTLVRKKGALDLPAIFNRIAAACPQARLRIIGRDNPDRRLGTSSVWTALQTMFTPAAGKRVEYLGPLPHEALQEQIRRAAVCVFPSYAEAFPLTWLEAMACGKALAGYDLPWAREAVGADAGLLSPAGDTAALADALLHLLADHEARTTLGSRARLRVEACFSQNRMLNETLEWYTEVLGNKRPAR